MFFYLSKILWFFLQPSSAMLILLLAGTCLLWTRWIAMGRRIVLLAVFLLLVTGLSPLGHALILPLEDRFSRPGLPIKGGVEGVVVLGGAQNMTITARRKAIAINEAAERLVEASILARRYPEARILFSGGSDAILGDRESEASGAKSILVSLGVSPERLLLEDESRNTYQNAVFSMQLAQSFGNGNWLLVTSASHMPRAMGSFRKAGFKVMPWPVDYRTRGREDAFRFFSKPSQGWRRVDLALREWIGLLVYRVTGRTDSLFPAPR